MKKHHLSILLLFIICTSANAQWKWFNPQEAQEPVIQNQGWSDEIGKTYTRLPDRAEGKVTKAVWNLSRQSAGLAIHFYSNASEIKVQYAVNGSLNMHHMPTTGVSGLDMYSINSDGLWNFCFGEYAFGDTITYHYKSILKNKQHDYGYEFRLYLPLYNSIKWLKIGVPEEARFDFVPASVEKPILVYGTSIAQGACASRPAMAWTSIIERNTGYPLINLGFSGSGKMEKEMIDFVGEIDARLFILDCLPNMSGYSNQDVAKRLIESVRSIRKKHTAPILMIEHAGYSNTNMDSVRKATVSNINEISLFAYHTLTKEGIKNLHYMYADEINLPPDGWVDYIHPNDLGMQTQAMAVEKKIREILHIPKGISATTDPVTQRREPYLYEWRKRHHAILTLNKNHPPKAVILGNSITHFWGGKPEGPRRNGEDSWNTHMEPAGFHNLGYGWDRIENVLWRVYHGELDGYEAENVTLMIGTNNMGISSDQDIVDGLRFLLKAIKVRQPKATIRVIGILPRRNHEFWVKKINTDIQTMAEEGGCKFINAGNILLKPDGKIDESFFSDGLHPNAKGYKLISTFIAAPEDE